TPQTFSPTITSDQADYFPGSTVTLTGANWGPGESVHLFVNDDIGQTWSYNTDVPADATGSFTNQFELPNWFVATYTVTATGSSGLVAQATFTDGTQTINSVSTSPFSPNQASSVGVKDTTDVIAKNSGNTADFRVRIHAGTVGGALVREFDVG